MDIVQVDRAPTPQAPRPRKRHVGWVIPTVVVVSWLLGCLVAVMNHAFFVGLQGQDADNGVPQSWITTAKNALATLAKILFGIAISTSLTQVTWRTARKNQLSIDQLDSVFSLPSPISVVRLWFGRSFIPLAPLLLAAGSIHVLILLPILVPGSLTVRLAADQNQTLSIPNVNLSDTNPGLMAFVLQDAGDTQPTLDLSSVVLRTMAFPSAPLWDPPDQCGASCSYSLNYSAPALLCSDLTAADIWDGDNSTTPTPNQVATLIGWQDGADDFIDTFVYNATSNLPPRGVPLNVSDPYNLTIVYLPPGDTPNPSGSTCVFYNATYLVDTTFNASGQFTDVNPVEYHDTLSDPWASPNDDCPWFFDPNANSTLDVAFPVCMAKGVNARALALAFYTVLSGNLQFNTGGLDETQVYLTSLFSVDPTQDNFTLNVDNLSAGLVGLMANVTLALMDLNFTTISVPVNTSSGELFYKYDSLQFWLVYGAAIFLSFVVSVFGLICLVSNGAPGTTNFSHLISTTRSPALTALAIHDHKHELSPSEKRTILAYGNVKVDEKSRVHSFGVVGQDDIVHLADLAGDDD